MCGTICSGNTNKITSFHCEAGYETCTVNNEGIGSCGGLAEQCIFRGDRIDMEDILIERWEVCFEAENKYREKGDYTDALRFDARRQEVEAIMRRSSSTKSLPGLLNKVQKRDVIIFRQPEEE